MFGNTATRTPCRQGLLTAFKSRQEVYRAMWAGSRSRQEPCARLPGEGCSEPGPAKFSVRCISRLLDLRSDLSVAESGCWSGWYQDGIDNCISQCSQVAKAPIHHTSIRHTECVLHGAHPRPDQQHQGSELESCSQSGATSHAQGP